MIHSMTGFGSGESSGELGTCRVEISAVNHRSLDQKFRLPDGWNSLEKGLGDLMRGAFTRGSFTIWMSWKPSERQEAQSVELNLPLVQAYVKALESIRQRFGLEGGLEVSTMANLPNVFRPQEPGRLLTEITPLAAQALQEAAGRLQAMRKTEGEALERDVRAQIAAIREQLQVVLERRPKHLAAYKEKLLQRISQLMDGQALDPGRLEQEVAIYADKSDINEECVRLASHCDQCDQFLELEEPVGRKLDFLFQEMHREVNTMGSKSGDPEISRAVLTMKSAVDKLREQAQNVE